MITNTDTNVLHPSKATTVVTVVHVGHQWYTILATLNTKGLTMTYEQKKEIIKNGLEFVHFAIQEAMNGNMDELEDALGSLELMREE